MYENLTTAQQKKFFRQRARHAAAQFYPTFRETCSDALCSQLEMLPEFYLSGPLFCFVGTNLEPDTMPIIRAALEQERQVAVPLCTDSGKMEARLIHDTSELKPGSFGILEPPSDAPVLERNRIAFAVVPCLCCDRRGVRLGHGGGYYDRYLAGAPFPWAVLCPEALLYDFLPNEVYDLTTPILVTEERSLRFPLA